MSADKYLLIIDVIMPTKTLYFRSYLKYSQKVRSIALLRKN